MKLRVEIELKISGSAHTPELRQGAIKCAIDGIVNGMTYVHYDDEMKYMSESKIISAKRVEAIVIDDAISCKISKCLFKLQNHEIDWGEAKEWIVALCNPKFNKEKNV